jgi:putative transposase
VRRLLLSDVVTELHLASRSTYGVRRIRASLWHERGLVVNKKLIRRIMNEQNLTGLPRPKKGRRYSANVATHEDLVRRNSLWLSDITEHKTREGTLYCCVVLNMYSRRVVGWAIDRRNEATQVNDALTMAANSRDTSPATALHADHGSQFTSWSFSQNLRHHRLLGSMGTVGDCYVNSPMESFWGSMQIELLNRKKWMTRRLGAGDRTREVE